MFHVSWIPNFTRKTAWSNPTGISWTRGWKKAWWHIGQERRRKQEVGWIIISFLRGLNAYLNPSEIRSRSPQLSPKKRKKKCGTPPSSSSTASTTTSKRTKSTSGRRSRKGWRKRGKTKCSVQTIYFTREAGENRWMRKQTRFYIPFTASSTKERGLGLVHGRA